MAFKKGQSGNPSGRPKIPKCVVEAAKAHTADAISALAEVARNAKEDPAARVKAAEALLNRAWGKPIETHQLTGKDGAPIQHAEVSLEQYRRARAQVLDEY